MESLESFTTKIVAMRIAGDIVLSDSPGASLRKWREYFGLSQQEVAKTMDISPSVLSDYEKGRRSPGTGFVKRFVRALLAIDEQRGSKRIENLIKALGIPISGVIDMQEFSRPLTMAELVEAVDGILLYPEYPTRVLIYGYTMVDSIRAIIELSSMQFYSLLGSVPERAIVFTRVTAGRSPMVAVRVSLVKPSVVVIHGPRRSIDYLSLQLAVVDRVPLIISTVGSVEELMGRLRAKAIMSSR